MNDDLYCVMVECESFVHVVNCAFDDFYLSLLDLVNCFSDVVEVMKMVKKINQYSSVVFGGRGYIIDHRNCREIIKFDFPLHEEKLAKKLESKILEWLNEKE